MKTEMAKVMEKAKTYATKKTFTNEEMALVQNVLLPDGMMYENKRGSGRTTLYGLTKKGKAVMGLGDFV